MIADAEGAHSVEEALREGAVAHNRAVAAAVGVEISAAEEDRAAAGKEDRTNRE